MSLDYIGVAPCGCLKIWASSSLDRKTLAKDVAKIVRSGLELRRVTTDEARAMTSRCHLCHPETAK